MNLLGTWPNAIAHGCAKTENILTTVVDHSDSDYLIFLFTASKHPIDKPTHTHTKNVPEARTQSMIRYFLLCESEPAHAGAPLRLRKPANRDQKAHQRHTNPTQPTTQKKKHRKAYTRSSEQQSCSQNLLNSLHGKRTNERPNARARGTSLPGQVVRTRRTRSCTNNLVK